MMPYIRRFTKLAYQQYKQLFLQFMLNFYLKSCVRYIKEMQQFLMYSVKKKKKAEGTRVRVSRLGENVVSISKSWRASVDRRMTYMYRQVDISMWNKIFLS